MHTIERTIEWHHLDATGHVHHVDYWAWVEACELEYRQIHGIGSFDECARTPRVHIEAVFRRALHLQDRITVSLRWMEVSGKRATYEWEIRRVGRVAASGTATLAYLDSIEGAPCEWSKAWQDMFAGDLIQT